MHILNTAAHPMAAPGFFEDPIMLIVLIVLAVLVWGVVFLVRRDGKQVVSHMQALGAYAKEHGYGYEPGVVEAFAEQHPELALSGKNIRVQRAESNAGRAPLLGLQLQGLRRERGR